MILLSSNKTKQLLLITFIGEVTALQCGSAVSEATILTSELQPGFSVLADLTSLNSMATDCAAEISRVMDLCAQHGVTKIIRVIPDPSKDIGFNILARFHYPNKPRTVTCETLVQAAQHLDQ